MFSRNNNFRNHNKKEEVFLSGGNLTLLIFLLLVEMLSHSLIQAEELYLIECDSLSPHNILFKEGIFGLMISFLGLINDTPFEKLNKVYNNSSSGIFTLFIFLCFIYIFLSGAYNIYKIYVVSLYSPMTVSLAQYFFNPFFMIYDFTLGGDDIVNRERNATYFILNLILSIVIAISGCIFNDFLIVKCCGLERDTYEEISKRGIRFEYNNITELIPYLKDEESESTIKTHIYHIYV